MNKKGIAPLIVVFYGIIILLIVYLLLFIPIPAFTRIKAIVNYFLIILLWIILQVGFVYLYITLGRFFVKAFRVVKLKVIRGSFSVRKFILTHS